MYHVTDLEQLYVQPKSEILISQSCIYVLNIILHVMDEFCFIEAVYM